MDADPPIPESNQVLSQSEVERLMEQASSKDTPVRTRDSAGARPEDPPERHDFRRPAYLSPRQMRKLRLRHEEFIRGLAARLSIHLRMEFNLKLSKLHTLTHEKFTEAMVSATHLTIFKIDPLRGLGVLEISPRLGLSIVDRLMGGSAQAVNADHDLSEIEMALIEQAAEIMLGEWCGQWSAVGALRPVLLGTETNGCFLQTSPPDTVMLVLTMEARLGDCVEPLQIGVPCHMLESLVGKLDDTIDPAVSPVAPSPSTPPGPWNRQFDEVQIPVTAEWSGIELSAREIINLKVGDVLMLDPGCASQVAVRLADLRKFIARLGTQGDQRAVEIAALSPG